MADVVATDVPKGTEVKWYGGGVVAQVVDLLIGAAAVDGGCGDWRSVPPPPPPVEV